MTLADEGPHFESLAIPSSETDIWEETALGVVAESGEYDVLLWAAGYALFGNGKGIWGSGASAEREIQLIAVPKSNRGTMSDSDFVRVGWTPSERLPTDALEVTADADAVTWDFDGLRFIAQPPVWRLEGKAGDAEFDLRYEQNGTPLWNWGLFAQAHESDRAAHGTRMYCYLLSTTNGTVDLPDGRTVTFVDHLTVNSFCRTILTAAETSEGPQPRKP